MQWYEDEVQGMEHRQEESPALTGQVIFYGSSSIRLWENLVEDFRDVGVLNLGFGGSTMEACAFFFERIVVPCTPRSIVCYAGDNDLGDGQQPEAVCTSFRNLKAKVDRHFPGIPFAFMSIKPSPARWPIVERIRLTNEMIRKELEGRPLGYYIDVFSPMLADDGLPDRSFFLEDGLHVSSKGYVLWKNVLAQWGKEIF
jgi:lysophospholipase L1-like esterase